VNAQVRATILEELGERVRQIEGAKMAYESHHPDLLPVLNERQEGIFQAIAAVEAMEMWGPWQYFNSYPVTDQEDGYEYAICRRKETP
jgi:hypothetical protein